MASLRIDTDVFGSTSSNRSPLFSSIPALTVSRSPTEDRSAKQWASTHNTEKQKLIEHILDKLERRKKPPSVFEALSTSLAKPHTRGLGAVVQTVRGVVGLSAGRKFETVAPQQFNQLSPSLSSEQDNDGEQDEHFSTYDTYDLMMQLRTVLSLSLAQGWHILSSDDVEEISNIQRKYTSRKLRSRSRSPFSAKPSVSRLLLRCIEIVASVVTEDCRFKIRRFTLEVPPNALQGATLDVASFLVHSNRHRPPILSEIAQAVIPAFYAWPTETHARLLIFFQRQLIPVMLHELRSAQEFPGHDGSNDVDDSEDSHPPVAIQVEEVQDDNTLNPNASFRLPTNDDTTSTNVLSSNAPAQSVAIYQLSSIVVPLLSAVLENVDTRVATPAFHAMSGLMKLMIDLKPDMYLDILSVIAYATPIARHAACCLMASYWPHAVGHVIVSKPLASLDYQRQLYERSSSTASHSSHFEHPYIHEFLPWRFGSGRDECNVCSSTLSGFGLKCPACLCSIHIDCYDVPDGNFHWEYRVASNLNVQKLAWVRFSHVFPHSANEDAHLARRGSHRFRLVNLFTLTLCFACQLPLWGCHAQAYKCSHCREFAHPHCVEDNRRPLPQCHTISEAKSAFAERISIDWSSLRQSFVDHYGPMILPEEALLHQTFEDVNVMLCILWTQLELFKNGVAAGSIIVVQTRTLRESSITQGNVFDDFELHTSVRLYQAYLPTGRLSLSMSMTEYLQMSSCRLSDYWILFDWPALIYLVSALKLPVEQEKNATGDAADGMLSVTPNLPVDADESSLEASSYPFEIVSLRHILTQLRQDFKIYNLACAQSLLQQLQELGFLERVDRQRNMTFEDGRALNTLYSFPLPSALDLSTDVETLVVAVESCLLEMDISDNEFGFLLLSRRLPPNGLSSDYALTRLAKTILSWIVAEDDLLVIVARDFVAQGKNLPGVRSNHDLQPWPLPKSSRPVAGTSVNSGGDYVAARRNLLTRYALPWLTAYHELDPSVYELLIYDLCSELGREVASSNSHMETDPDHWDIADTTLRLMLKLHQSSVTFSGFGSMISNWLESLLDLQGPQVLSSLPRLFAMETEASQRISFLESAIGDQVKLMSTDTIDLWEMLMGIVSSSLQSLQKGLKWLHIFVHSGVEVPVDVLTRFNSLARDFDLAFPHQALLLQSIFLAVWLRSYGMQKLQTVLADVHVRFRQTMKTGLETNEKVEVRALRHSLCSSLVLCGVERDTLLKSRLALESDISTLPSRRKAGTRNPGPLTSTMMSSDLMECLALYATSASDEVQLLLAKFLDKALSTSNTVEVHHMDHFIITNGSHLLHCAWVFYISDTVGLTDARVGLLLRVLAVNAEPLLDRLALIFQSRGNREERQQALCLIFRLMLDMSHPAFDEKEVQWRTSVGEIIPYFFKAMWEDEFEDIRIMSDAWSQSLLIPHLDSITQCWSEAIPKLPVPHKLSLVSFLIQLSSKFPSWQVLTWKCIDDCLSDEDGVAADILSLYGVQGKENRLTQILDPEKLNLKIAMMILTLRLLSSGAAIDILTLQKMKMHLVSLLNFSQATLVYVGNSHECHVEFGKLQIPPPGALSCLSSLVLLMDAPYFSILPKSAMTSIEPTGTAAAQLPNKLLVGSIMVDVCLRLFLGLKIDSLDPLTMRSLLELITIVIQKHDFENAALRWLQKELTETMGKLIKILNDDINMEIRELVLTVCQAFMVRWPDQVFPILIQQFLSVSQLIHNLKMDVDEVLVTRGVSFLEFCLLHFSTNGLLWNICKQPLDNEFFTVLKFVFDTNPVKAFVGEEMLQDVVLRDALARMADQTTDAAMAVILSHLPRYVEATGASCATDLPAIARLFGTIARHIAELNLAGFSADNLLILLTNLFSNLTDTEQSTLSPVAEVILRVVLPRCSTTSSALGGITSHLRRHKTIARVEQQGSQHATDIDHLLIEMLLDALRMRSAMRPVTISAIATTLDPDKLNRDDMIRFIGEVLTYLQLVPITETHLEKGRWPNQVMLSRLILRSCSSSHREDVLSVLDGRTSPVTLRAWNVVAYSALTAESPLIVVLELFRHASASYQQTILTLLNSTTPFHESRSPDINNLHVCFKIWVLLARANAMEQVGKDELTTLALLKERQVWNHFWPQFEKLVELSAQEAQLRRITPVISSLWLSLANLVQFIHLAKSSIALDSASHVNILTRLTQLSVGDSIAGRLSRSLRVVQEAAASLPFENLVHQVSTEVHAAEKLYSALAIEANRNIEMTRRREAGERRRENKTV